MGVCSKPALNVLRGILAMLIAAAALPLPACADEIRLKDGKKLYGVIVAYEENMFKVKTEFGYVLVEKDKIASIIPTAPPAPPESSASAKNNADTAKSPSKDQPKTESAVTTGAEAAPTATPASAKVAAPAPPGAPGKHDKSAKMSAVKPESPAKSTSTEPAAAPAIKANPPAANPGATSAPQTIASSAPPAPPKAPEPPPIQEEVQGNIYINHTHGFRMYKAPSWQVIDDARNALPNAIVAMGTPDESSLMVLGKESTKQSLDAAAVTVEKRLREVYANYQQTSQRKTVIGGLSAVEFRYVGKADEHDWSGTLVVIARGNEIFTVLGMTYADSDLIQIQENVIAKSIASLNFDAH
jgi:hypothetical protein